jgi:hypothetical protein
VTPSAGRKSRILPDLKSLMVLRKFRRVVVFRGSFHDLEIGHGK